MEDGHPLPNGLPQIPGARLMTPGPLLIPKDGRTILCMHCDEPIETAIYVLYPATPFGFHPECAMRAVVGSVGHQTMRCSCYGGDYDDPPGMTPREAAIAAWKLFEARKDARN